MPKIRLISESLVSPIMRDHIWVKCWNSIGDTDISNNHSKPTIWVNSIFLPISETLPWLVMRNTVWTVQFRIGTQTISIVWIVDIQKIQKVLPCIPYVGWKDPSFNSDLLIIVLTYYSGKDLLEPKSTIFVIIEFRWKDWQSHYKLFSNEIL